MGIKLRYMILAVGLWSIVLVVLLMKENSSAEVNLTEQALSHHKEKKIKMPSTEHEPQHDLLRHPKEMGHIASYSDAISKERRDKERGFEYDGIRASRNHIMELWYFIKSQIKDLDESVAPEKRKYILEGARERMSSALIEVELMYERKQQQAEVIKHLHEVVKTRIHQLQNPENCTDVKKLVCDVNIPCGFGCELHHIALCLIISLGTKRTFVLKSYNWRYSSEGWESMFMPVSNTCTKAVGKPVMWNGEKEIKNEPVVSLPIVANLMNRPSYIPLNIPRDLAPLLQLYHGNPAVWWVGQIISYLIRPQPWLKKAIAEHESNIGFMHPVVGIHVRRTDKLYSEASFHSLSEYMVHVEDWYAKEDLKRQRLGRSKLREKRVYIASDDPTVLKEARIRYPEYKYVGDEQIAKSAGLNSRYSKSGITGLVFDVILLSKCDFFIGTFSSQISRAIYELMQTRHPDATTFAHSLDDIYYFAGQDRHFLKAIYDHKPIPGSEEIEMLAGDLIHTLGNHWDGYSKGINKRTGKEGLYPSFKATVDIISTARFPPLLGSVIKDNDNG